MRLRKVPQNKLAPSRTFGPWKKSQHALIESVFCVWMSIEVGPTNGSNSASSTADDTKQLSPHHAAANDDEDDSGGAAPPLPPPQDDPSDEDDAGGASDKENMPPPTHASTGSSAGVLDVDDEHSMSEMVAKVQRQEKALYKQSKSVLQEIEDLDNIEDLYADTNLPEEPHDDNFRAIWVSGFAMRIGDVELKAIFKACGNIRRATVICDRYTWKSKGYVQTKKRVLSMFCSECISAAQSARVTLTMPKSSMSKRCG